VEINIDIVDHIIVSALSIVHSVTGKKESVIFLSYNYTKVVDTTMNKEITRIKLA